MNTKDIVISYMSSSDKIAIEKEINQDLEARVLLGSSGMKEREDSKFWEPRFVAKIGEQVIGYIALDMISISRIGQIDNIFVVKDFRGKGVSKLLLERVEREIRVFGFDTLRANIFGRNIHSRKFFSTNGFVPDGERKHGERIGNNRDSTCFYFKQLEDEEKTNNKESKETGRFQVIPKQEIR